MASSVPPGQPSAEATFRNYSSKQAEGYAKGWRGYPPALIKFTVNHHHDTGGKMDILLDVGCGPATRLATYLRISKSPSGPTLAIP